MDEQKTILSISSHVMRGSVGNRAVVFALETRGHAVWSVPTVILPWHPGHGPSTRIPLATEAFTSALHDLERAKWRGEVGAVMTGYFAEDGQVRAAAALIRALKREDPKAVYLCDPVIGDAGGLYVSAAVAQAIRDELLPLADIATPNRFELAWLADQQVDDNPSIAAAARRTGVPCVVATSAHAMIKGAIANLLVDGDRLVLVEHQALERAPNGLGDLFSALFLSHWLARKPGDEALRLASASVFEIAARSIRAGADELLLQVEAASLKTPMATVTIRNLMSPGTGPRRAVVGALRNGEQAG